MVFCFVQIFFFGQHKSQTIFFLSRKARNVFPEFNIRLYDKNSDSELDYFFFPPPKSEYFFQQHWESILFQKETITLPATFFVRQDVFSSKDTSCQEGCKITNKNINRQHQNQRRSEDVQLHLSKNSPFKGYQIFSERILKCCASVRKA